MWQQREQTSEITVLEQSYSLLEYLSAVAREIGPKPVRDVTEHQFKLWPDDVADHSAIKVGPSGESPAWMRVRRVEAPQPAIIPEHLKPYLKNSSALTSPVSRPELDVDVVTSSVTKVAAEELGGSPGEGQEDSWQEGKCAREKELRDSTVSEFESWVNKTWSTWSEQAMPTYRARQLYSGLYDLHLRSESESATHEVVWGYLVLSCLSDDERIVAPLFTVNVTVQINPDTGEIIVEPESTVQLELDSIEGAGLTGLDHLSGMQSEFRHSPPDLWSDEERLQVRKRLVAPLGVDAGLDESTMPSRLTEAPRLNDGWVLMLRKRALRQERFYDELADKIYNETFVPEALASVVSDSDSVDRALISLGREVQSDDGTADRLLMPLPTNQEQERIARQLAHSRGVTVQGPPGTGKSHTIVNLVSHLVPQGKRVLVTAEKEQALTVLRDKIPEELRDLSLAVLGSTPAAMEDLRSAVQSMQDSLSSIEVTQEERRIADLEQRVDELRQSLLRIDSELVEALRSEQREYDSPAGLMRAPELAEWFAEHRDSAVIGDPVPPEAGNFPLTDTEFSEFITTLRSVSTDDASAAIRDLPDLASIPTGEELAAKLRRLDELQSQVTELEDGGLDLDGVDSLDKTSLDHLVFDIRQHVALVRQVEGVWEDRLAEQVRRGSQEAQWTTEQNKRLVGLLIDTREEANKLAAHTVSVPEGNPVTQFKLIDDWKVRVAAGKKISFFSSKELKEFADSVKVDSYPVMTVEQLELVRSKVELDRQLKQIRTLMIRAYRPLNIPIPEPGETFRFQADRTATRIALIAEVWGGDYRSLSKRLSGIAASEDPAGSADSLEKLVALLQLATSRYEQQELLDELEVLKERVRASAEGEGASPLWWNLLTALEMARADQWSAALVETQRLLEIRSRVVDAQELRERIAEAGAPYWAGEIVQTGATQNVVGEPENVSLAWELAKARSWLSHLHGLVDVDDLMGKSHDQSRELQVSVVELASRSARVELKKNMLDRQRRALETWLTAVKRVGKGTGKNAPRFQAAAREALPKAMGAVPIWIMPIYRVMENFDPRVSDLFDVVIVDESSQADLLTLGVLALGKKAVIVGDDKQTTPDRVGIQVDRISALQDQHLKGFPQAEAKLLTLDESLYSISGRAFSSIISLKEHFRCVPEIIEFSNRYYNHSILPLREVGVPQIGEPLRAVKVEGAISEKSGTHRINRDEAKAIADQIKACVDDPAYDGLTFGVVSFVSGIQSNIIQDEIRNRIGDEEFEKRRLRVGNPPLFQGDERNVMFISMVAHDNSFAATTGRYPQWANVAASRARDQLWVFYSMDPTTLHHEDQRRFMIEYVQGHGRRKDSQDLFELTESKFERDVLQQLLDRGYDVVPQHRVGSYRIDFVVNVGKGERLAVECDGDTFHGPDKWDDDVRRQRVLERLGWKFWRIRASAYYFDREESMKPLWERLEQLRARVVQSDSAAKAQEEAKAEQRLEVLRDDLDQGIHSDLLRQQGPSKPRDHEADIGIDDHRVSGREPTGKDSRVSADLRDDGQADRRPTSSEPSHAEAGDSWSPLGDEDTSTPVQGESATVREMPVQKPFRQRETTTPAQLRRKIETKGRADYAASTQSAEQLGTPFPTGPVKQEHAHTVPKAADLAPTTLSQEELRQVWSEGRPYVLNTAGDVLDGRTGHTLADAVGTIAALEMRDRMRAVRKHGGRFRVDELGRMVTFVDKEIVFVCHVSLETWFPHHWE